MANICANSNMCTYESKKKALFDCLDTAEKEIKGTILDQSSSSSLQLVHTNNLNRRENQSVECSVVATVDRNLSKFRGTESLFKKPELPIVKCLPPRTTPDFQANPHKWKKYSLLDVDISDRTNSAAAFTFLQEIEATKDSQPDDCDGMSDKITFNKPKTRELSLRSIADPNDDDDNKPVLKGSKLVMPEYVIGQKTAKKRKRTQIDGSSTTCKNAMKSQLKLSHLQDDDDNELVLNLEDIPIEI